MHKRKFFRNIVEKKWSYWDSYWSFVEWTIILTSISAVGFYLYKASKSVGDHFVKGLNLFLELYPDIS